MIPIFDHYSSCAPQTNKSMKQFKYFIRRLKIDSMPIYVLDFTQNFHSFHVCNKYYINKRSSFVLLQKKNRSRIAQKLV